jgi:hypothetical protein
MALFLALTSQERLLHFGELNQYGQVRLTAPGQLGGKVGPKGMFCGIGPAGFAE